MEKQLAGEKSRDRIRRLKQRKKHLRERALGRMEIRKELKNLEVLLRELQIQYEQYFMGVIPHEPVKLHREVKKLIREIRKAPFKKPAIRYRQLTLESRYQTYNDYWQRVLRKREDGTYSKDVFKAAMRERHSREDRELGTVKGSAAASMRSLFLSYKQALERQTGLKQNIDFKSFQKVLMTRAKAHRAKHGNQKLAFRVVVKEGRVSIKVRARSKAVLPPVRQPVPAAELRA